MSTAQVLVVGGGGAGRGNGAAGNSGDGGSAGQFIYNASVVANSAITVIVGLGGIGVANAPGNNGDNSVFGAITATGGVGGQNTSSSVPRRGGDGAGGAGGAGATPNAGAGGAGTVNPITGTTLAGGGGGGFSYGGVGGAGGGGRGEDYSVGNALPGTANSGGGGGGVSNSGATPGKNGGSGIVIIRYVTADFGVCIGGTKTTDGIYTIHTFTTSGTLTMVGLVTSTYAVALTLERGPHTISVQATDSAGTVTASPITYVMAYELSDYGIDIYSGDAKLDAFGITLHDALLPDLPTLNFSCATLLTGTIGAVIRERGLRQYQFTVATVGASNGIYAYTCKAAESYALTTAIMALQTAYGSTADAIKLLVPSLNIVNAELLAQTTYPQLFANITPTEIIKQLMIQALAQASVRNGNLYVFPLDVSGQTPDYHMQRLDPLTGWQRDADIYDAVIAHYIVKQYPTPDTFMTLHDAANWYGAVTDVTQVADTLLPVPSGASGMLKSIGNCSRAALSILFRDMDRIQFNWNPVTAAYVDISLQQDGANKLDLRHYFAGQSGAGFVLNTGTASTDVLYKDIALSPIQFVTTVTGTTTAGCSYRVTLLNAANAPIWQGAWIHTVGNAFVANVPPSVSQTYPATKVRIEFKDLYLIGTDYGVQAVTCTITGQTYNNVGSHERVVSSTQYYVNIGSHVNVVSSVTYSVAMNNIGNYVYTGSQGLPAATSSQWYDVSSLGGGPCDSLTLDSEHVHAIYYGDGPVTQNNAPYYISVVATLRETVQDYEWQTVVVTETVQDYEWQPFTLVGDLAFFNLFESVDLVLSDFTRTGNPTNLTTIALTWTGDNYLDTLVLVADNPLPVTVRAGTGARAYPVTDDFGGEAGAQAYADGLLPIVSVAREQYTRDVSLETDLGVGDTINGDGTNYTIYAVDYRQSGKTLAAGRAMDTLMTRLAEQARRLGTLERKA